MPVFSRKNGDCNWGIFHAHGLHLQAVYTLPKSNIPLRIGHPKSKGLSDCLPTINFQVKTERFKDGTVT